MYCVCKSADHKFSSYPSTTQLQQYIDILSVLKEAMESNNVFVANTSMNVYLLCHLHYKDIDVQRNTQANA